MFFEAADFFLLGAGQVDDQRRPLLLQDLSITHYPVTNRSRDLFPVVAHREFAYFVRVRQKTTFHQYCWMPHVREDKELLRRRPAIHRLGARDEGLLDKDSQTLTFRICRFQ